MALGLGPGPWAQRPTDARNPTTRGKSYNNRSILLQEMNPTRSQSSNEHVFMKKGAWVLGPGPWAWVPGPWAQRPTDA